MIVINIWWLGCSGRNRRYGDCEGERSGTGAGDGGMVGGVLGTLGVYASIMEGV